MWELLHHTVGAKVKITLKFLYHSEIIYKEEQKIVFNFGEEYDVKYILVDFLCLTYGQISFQLLTIKLNYNLLFAELRIQLVICCYFSS